jgi:hypothetical protein
VTEEVASSQSGTDAKNAEPVASRRTVEQRRSEDEAAMRERVARRRMSAINRLSPAARGRARIQESNVRRADRASARTKRELRNACRREEYHRGKKAIL